VRVSELTAIRSGKAVAVASGLAFLVAAAPAMAQSDAIPMPRPNPFITASAAGPEAAGAGDVAMPAPQPAAAAAGPVDQATALARINDYFNSFRTMEGEFVQVGPHGEQSQGVFVIQKPGKIRFHYKPPVRLDVISDGSTVAIEDKKAKTQDMYPLSKTPLRYLLADRIDLTSGHDYEVREENDLISLVIVEKSKLIDGKLTLIFDRKSYELRQWVVTDGQGLDTSVAIFNTATGKQPDPQLFKIYRMKKQDR
jgi:outer membrane lipoprotein-sorting protein